MKRPDPLYFESFALEPRKGDLKKLEIIRAAIACFARGGIEGGLEQVAKKLKIRRSHVVYYFKTREELFAAAVKHAIITAQSLTIERLRRAKSPEAKIRAIVESAFAWAKRHPDEARVLLLFHSLCASNKDLLKLNTEIRLAAFERISAVLRESSKADEAKVSAVAWMILGQIWGLLVDQLTTDQRTDFEGFACQSCLILLSQLER